MRLPASEQRQTRVPFRDIAAELELFWPRTEGRNVWQVNLLTLAAGAKFPELANIVVCSQDWTHFQHFTNADFKMSTFILWCNMNFGSAEVDGVSRFWDSFALLTQNISRRCLFLLFSSDNESLFLSVRPCFVLMGELVAHAHSYY